MAAAGLVAVATAVSPALLAAGPGTGPVFGTNPMAYSVPRAGRPPFTVDQASSSSAFVSVRHAAARGTPLPEGWAVDADGRPTTDPEAALAGALLPFGGYKGANIALLVELLSSMAGGRWAVDAPPWDSGPQSPSIGMSSSRSTTAQSVQGSPRASKRTSDAWPASAYGCQEAVPPSRPLFRPAT